MDIYFYCTYENSERGFFPLRLNENGITAMDGSCGEELPEQVWDFFSFDRFKILWREYPEDNEVIYFPNPGYGIFGIQRIEGNFDGRCGVVNFAAFADKDELWRLENLAAASIRNFSHFSDVLLNCMIIGGEFGYSVDTDKFLRSIEKMCSEFDSKALSSDKGGKLLLKILKRKSGIMTQKDLMRFAVCTDEWENIYRYMGNERIWRKKPKNVVSEAEFEMYFIN